MALHLCLLIGQFVILHLKTEITHRLSDTTFALPFYSLQLAVIFMALARSAGNKFFCWGCVFFLFSMTNACIIDDI